MGTYIYGQYGIWSHALHPEASHMTTMPQHVGNDEVGRLTPNGFLSLYIYGESGTPSHALSTEALHAARKNKSRIEEKVILLTANVFRR